ncbi:MAG TPA: TetR/AcrR family transcriptional regulator [Solirubrobacteraceae bacterium]|jgi:AcrR family transcriptional regulator|nr:TetR/AcrR family transcriptional regulator [Solirubrobacteraceae bacterium]
MATPPLTERPMRADARRNRERVLDAAAHCFSADGLQAQMDEIAGRAKVGVGTVYRHFPTKDALIEALADEYFAHQAEAARAALEVEDPWEAFSGYVRQASEILGDNRALAEVIRDRPGMMGDAALRAAEELGFFDTLSVLIDRAQEAGALRQDFRLEDIPLIMCALGSLQTTHGAYSSWRRSRAIILDGLRAPGYEPLPDEPVRALTGSKAQR